MGMTPKPPKGFSGQPYDLKALAESGPVTNPPKSLRAIHERLSTQRTLRVEINKILTEAARVVRVAILPQFGRSGVFDDDAGDWASIIAVALRQAIRASQRRIRALLEGEGDRHTRQWRAVVKTSIRVDLSAVVREEDLTDYMSLAVERSFSLIQGLADDLVRNLERVFRQAVLDGSSTTELRKLVRSRLNVSKSRAALIARDQTSTLVSELNQARQIQAGITQYEWSTSRDERVRERHEKLDGRTFRWGEATPAEGGQSPGKPINCRCVAIPIL